MTSTVARRPRRTREESEAQRAEDEAREAALRRYRLVYECGRFVPLLDGRKLEGTPDGLAQAIELLTIVCERRGYRRSYLAGKTLAWLINVAVGV